SVVSPLLWTAVSPKLPYVLAHSGNATLSQNPNLNPLNNEVVSRAGTEAAAHRPKGGRTGECLAKRTLYTTLLIKCLAGRGHEEGRSPPPCTPAMRRAVPPAGAEGEK